MPSHRENVLEALFAKLFGLVWFKSRRRNWINMLDPKDDYPALVLFDGGDDLDEYSPVQNEARLRADVFVAVRTATPEELGPALSEARARVIQALGADPHLGGLVSQVRHVATTDPDYADQIGQPPEASMTLALTITTLEGVADPYS